MDPQPRLVTRPTPWAGETRHDFVYGTMYSLLAGANRGGDAYWLTIDRDDHGNASALLLLDPAEVVVDGRRAAPAPAVQLARPGRRRRAT